MLMKLFTAPVYVGLSAFSSIHNDSNNFDLLNIISSVIKNFFSNIKNIFLNPHFNIVIFINIFLLSTFLLFSKKIEKKEFSNFPLLIVVITSLLTFLCFYTSYYFFLEKQLAFLIPILIFIVLTNLEIRNHLVLVAILVISPQAYAEAKTNILNRKSFYAQLKQYENYTKSFMGIKNYITSKENQINILFNYNEFDIPNHMVSCFLPLSVNGKPILYTTNVTDENAKIDDIFQIHNKIRLDYMLSRNELNFSIVNLVYKNENYFLYELNTKYQENFNIINKSKNK
jgi:hypothetical protein